MFLPCSRASQWVGQTRCAGKFLVANRWLEKFVTTKALRVAVTAVLLGIVIARTGVALARPTPVFAAPPTTMTYQGKITKSDGTNLTTGDATHTCLVSGADTCDLRFNIYADSAGSTLVRTEIFANVELVDNDGIFTLTLNSVCADSTHDGWTSENVANCTVANGGVTWNDDFYYTLDWDTDGDADFNNTPTGTLQTFPSSGTQSLNPVGQSLAVTGASKETFANNVDGTFAMTTDNSSFTSNQIKFNLIQGSGASYNRWIDFVDSTNTISILTGTQDPTSVATSASVGSLFLREVSGSSGKLYIKQDDGSSTNWTEAGSGTGVSAGTTTNSTLRWNGSAWVENTNLLSLSTGTASTAAHLTFYDTGTASKIQVLNGQDFGVQLSAGGDVGLTERLTILTNGQTGLGDTTPEAMLHVNGSAAQSGSANLSTSGTSATVTTTGAAFTPVEVGAAVTANSITRYVTAKASSTSLTIDEATNWSAGYSFTFKNPLLKLTDNGTLRTVIRPDGYLDHRASATISGTLAVGVMNQSEAAACSASTEGTMFYDKFDKIYKFCDGESWKWVGSPLEVTRKTVQTRTVLCSKTLTSAQTFDTTTECGSLPSTYTHLEVNMKARSTRASNTSDYARIFFNNDTTTTNYRTTINYGSDTTSTTSEGDDSVIGEVGGATAPANSFANISIKIPNYNDNKYKVASGFFGNNRSTTTDSTGTAVSIWEATSAITRILLNTQNASGNTFDTGSYFEVVGVVEESVVTNVAGNGSGSSSAGDNSFKVHRNGVDQSGVASNTATKPDFTTEEYDTNNGYNITSDRFQPSVAGKYLLIGQVGVDVVAADTGGCVAMVYKNGSLYSSGTFHSNGAAGSCLSTIAVVVEANGTTDYFELYGSHTDTTSSAFLGAVYYTQFSGHILSSGSSGSGTSTSASSFAAYLSADQTGIAASTDTKINFSAESFDSANYFDLSNDRFLPTSAGQYYLTGTVSMDSVASTGGCVARIYKNGSLFKQGTYYINGGTGACVSTVNAVVDANGSTDYFELYVYHQDGSTASALSGSDDTRFEGHAITGGSGGGSSSSSSTTSGGGANLVKNYPSIELATAAQPEWWEEQDANITLTEETAASQSVTGKHTRVLKGVTGASGANKYFYQRFTHADEPLFVDSTTKVSASAWVYVSTAGTVTMSLYNNGGAASLGSTTVSTTGQWIHIQLNNITIGTTSTDLRFAHSANSATFYVAMPQLNIGSTAGSWSERALVYRQKFSNAVVNAVDPAGGSWTDVDFTSVTNGLTAKVQVSVNYSNTTTAGASVSLRPNGSSETGNSTLVVRNVSTSIAGLEELDVYTDDGQIIEYDSSPGAGDTEALSIHMQGYWEWAIAGGGGSGGGVSGGLYDQHRQDITTNSVVSSQVVRKGWGYTPGLGGADLLASVTFGITYSDVPMVLINSSGYTATTPPDSLDDCVNGAAGINSTSYAITTTGFGVYLRHTDAAAVPSSLYVCYSWIAIGTAPNSYGADLAEYYRSSDMSIQSGDVVSLDTTQDISVKKSGFAYDPQMMGVIATNPGVVLGASDGTTPGVVTALNGDDVRSGTAQAVRVALAGRVPVKVSMQNGPIKRGDPLTASSIPGVAMKATRPGQIIGRALEDYDGSVETAAVLEEARGELTEEEAQELQAVLGSNASSSSIGKVMMFVQPGTSTYYGESLDPLAQLASRLLNGTNLVKRAPAVAPAVLGTSTSASGLSSTVASGSSLLVQSGALTPSGEATGSASATESGGLGEGVSLPSSTNGQSLLAQSGALEPVLPASGAANLVDPAVLGVATDSASLATSSPTLLAGSGDPIAQLAAEMDEKPDLTDVRTAARELIFSEDDLVLPLAALFVDTYLDVAGDVYVQGKLGVGEEIRVGNLAVRPDSLALWSPANLLSTFTFFPEGVSKVTFFDNFFTLDREALAATLSGTLYVNDLKVQNVLETSALKISGTRAGSLTFPAEKTELEITVDGLAPDSIIIVTPTANLPAGTTYYVEKSAGKFFLKLSQPLEEARTFDYAVLR